MQAVVKKVVYSFRYRPGQAGREVFHVVLTSKSNYPIENNEKRRSTVKPNWVRLKFSFYGSQSLSNNYSWTVF